MYLEQNTSYCNRNKTSIGVVDIWPLSFSFLLIWPLLIPSLSHPFKPSWSLSFASLIDSMCGCRSLAAVDLAFDNHKGSIYILLASVGVKSNWGPSLCWQRGILEVVLILSPVWRTGSCWFCWNIELRCLIWLHWKASCEFVVVFYYLFICNPTDLQYAVVKLIWRYYRSTLDHDILFQCGPLPL